MTTSAVTATPQVVSLVNAGLSFLTVRPLLSHLSPLYGLLLCLICLLYLVSFLRNSQQYMVFEKNESLPWSSSLFPHKIPMGGIWDWPFSGIACSYFKKIVPCNGKRLEVRSRDSRWDSQCYRHQRRSPKPSVKQKAFFFWTGSCPSPQQ